MPKLYDQYGDSVKFTCANGYIYICYNNGEQAELCIEDAVWLRNWLSEQIDSGFVFRKIPKREDDE